MIHFLWRFFLTLLTPFIFGTAMSAIMGTKASPNWLWGTFTFAWFVTGCGATAFMVKWLCDFAATDW